MTRRIVFPDAPSSWKVFFNDKRISRLEAVGEFSLDFCDSHPAADMLADRIGNAEGIISGWGVSNNVLDSVPNLEVISFVGLGVSNFF
jgi:phosphoglycerate dehydrogenase-like enzyme